MKKVVVWLSILVLVILAVAGCGRENSAATTGSGAGEAGQSPVISQSGEVRDGEVAANENASSDKVGGEGKNGRAGSAGVLENSNGKGTAGVSGSGSVSEKAQVPPSVTSGKRDEEKYVILWVTGDYGRKVLFNKRVPLSKGRSVLDVLCSHTSVTTGYGGGFVVGINGLKSERSSFGTGGRDWFYYVNGIFADVGAADFQPPPGAVIWWDYHDWSGGGLVPAVVGAYPEPFRSGFRSTPARVVIVGRKTDGDLLKIVKEAFVKQGVPAARIRVSELSEAPLQDRRGPTVVIGRWVELESIGWLRELNENYKKNGTFIHFSGTKLELLNGRGEVARTVGRSAGVVVATGSGSGDPAPLWLISGTDGQGLELAVKLLAEMPEKLKMKFGVVVLPGETVTLPVQ